MRAENAKAAEVSDQWKPRASSDFVSLEYFSALGHSGFQILSQLCRERKSEFGISAGKVPIWRNLGNPELTVKHGSHLYHHWGPDGVYVSPLNSHLLSSVSWKGCTESSVRLEVQEMRKGVDWGNMMKAGVQPAVLQKNDIITNHKIRIRSWHLLVHTSCPNRWPDLGLPGPGLSPEQLERAGVLGLDPPGRHQQVSVWLGHHHQVGPLDDAPLDALTEMKRGDLQRAVLSGMCWLSSVFAAVSFIYDKFTAIKSSLDSSCLRSHGGLQLSCTNWDWNWKMSTTNWSK